MFLYSPHKIFCTLVGHAALAATCGMFACSPEKAPTDAVDAQEVTTASTSAALFGWDFRVTYRKEKIPAVDMHLHTGVWDNIPAAMQQVLKSNLPSPFNLMPRLFVDAILSATGIAAQLDYAGIGHGVLMAVYAPHTVGVTTNEFVSRKISARKDRFFGLASVSIENWDNDEEEQLRQLGEYLARPDFIGVKMAHPHMGIAYNDTRFDSIYAVAGQYGKPVYIHAGNTRAVGSRTDPEATDPAYLEEAIASHPATVFILGHMGFDFINVNLGHLETVLDLAERYPNVALEASALGTSTFDADNGFLAEIYTQVKGRDLLPRIVYGSDGPQRPGFVKDYLQRTLDAMDAAGYSAAEARRVLFGNFCELFGLDEKSLL